jgi:hypothetical protein
MDFGLRSLSNSPSVDWQKRKRPEPEFGLKHPAKSPEEEMEEELKKKAAERLSHPKMPGFHRIG